MDCSYTAALIPLEMPVLWDMEALKMVGCRKFLLACFVNGLNMGRQTGSKLFILIPFHFRPLGKMLLKL